MNTLSPGVYGGFMGIGRPFGSVAVCPPEPIDRSQPVFWTVENTPSGWIRINRARQAASAVAKVEGFNFHDFQHQAATDLPN